MTKVVIFPFDGFEKIGAETYLKEICGQENISQADAAELVLIGGRQERRTDPRLIRWAERHIERWRHRPCSYAREPFPPVRVSEFKEQYWKIISDNDTGEHIVVSDSPIRYA